MFPVYFSALAIIAGSLQIFFLKTPPLTAFLLAFIVSTIGLQGLFSFCGHFYTPDKVAKGIGWPPGNPFQTEIAFTNLSFGILGILSIWFHGDFWLATIVGRSVFIWGAGYVHIQDIKRNKNSSHLNAGPVLYFDIALPLVLFGLYVAEMLT
ncbi:MAG: hypothetical protein KJ804_16955 [Proteobacteria bacterium]|nr:hypothetical protein [Pseudomonadota bacterium]MBU1059998.1 hypothetical protein [Pseudomonadota bacterium]